MLVSWCSLVRVMIMSNLNFDSNKIKKKWKELYTEKDKIISFMNNFDRSNSKFASKVYIEESKKNKISRKIYLN